MQATVVLARPLALMARGRRGGGGGSSGGGIPKIIIGGLITTLVLFLIVANIEPYILPKIQNTSWETTYYQLRDTALTALGLSFIGFLVLGAVYVYRIAQTVF